MVGLARPYWRQLVIAGICLAISSLVTLAMPLFLQQLVNSVVVNKDAAMMTTLTLGLVGLFVVQSVFNFAQSYLLSYTGERLVTDLRKRVFTHLQSLSLSFYDNQRVGELTSRLSNDVTVVQAGLTNNLLNLVQQLITLVGGITIIIIMDWHILLLVLVIVPPVVLISSFFGKRLGSTSEAAQSALGTATTVLEEELSPHPAS